MKKFIICLLCIICLVGCSKQDTVNDVVTSNSQTTVVTTTTTNTITKEPTSSEQNEPTQEEIVVSPVTNMETQSTITENTQKVTTTVTNPSTQKGNTITSINWKLDSSKDYDDNALELTSYIRSELKLPAKYSLGVDLDEGIKKGKTEIAFFIKNDSGKRQATSDYELTVFITGTYKGYDASASSSENTNTKPVTTTKSNGASKVDTTNFTIDNNSNTLTDPWGKTWELMPGTKDVNITSPQQLEEYDKYLEDSDKDLAYYQAGYHPYINTGYCCWDIGVLSYSYMFYYSNDVDPMTYPNGLSFEEYKYLVENNKLILFKHEEVGFDGFASGETPWRAKWISQDDLNSPNRHIYACQFNHKYYYSDACADVRAQGYKEQK